MTGLIKGNDVLFLVDKGDGYVPFVCAKDLSIEITASLVPVTTVGDGPWERSRYSSLGYSVSMTGVSRFSQSDLTAFDIIEHQINFLPLKSKIVFTDQEDNNQKIFKGDLLIPRASVSGNASAFSLSDFTLTGTGKLNIISCGAMVGTVETQALDASSFHVTLSDITGNPASYFYQLDSDFEQESTSPDFNIFNVPGGEHTLIITPACTSGNRGESTVYDFANNIIQENLSCGVPTAITISEQAINSFKVNWNFGTGNTSINISVKNVQTGSTQKFLNLTGTSYTIGGRQGNTMYEVSVQGNCGGSGLSTSTVVQARTKAGTGLSQLIINNGSDSVTITRIKINSITHTTLPILPHTTFAVNLIQRLSPLEIDYTSTAGDASIEVVTRYDTVCQLAQPSGSFTNTYTGFNAGTGDIVINVNPNLCP